MAQANTHRQTKTSKNQKTTKQLRNNNFVPFLATFAGVAFGVLVSLGFMAPIMKSDVASATKGLGSQVVSMLPASSVTACGGANGNGSGSGAGAGMKTASMTQPGKGGSQSGGGQNGGGTTWVHNFVSGIFATETGSNSNTGPDSHNSVDFTNRNTTTVNNNTNISVENNNPQFAGSGSSHDSGNTTGGDSQSGAAENQSSSSYDFNIEN